MTRVPCNMCGKWREQDGYGTCESCREGAGMGVPSHGAALAQNIGVAQRFVEDVENFLEVIAEDPRYSQTRWLAERKVRHGE